jgi:hypothetical protein
VHEEGMLDREVPFVLTLVWLAGLGGMGLGWLLNVDWSIDNSHNQYNSDVEWLSALLQRHQCSDGLLAWFLTGGGTARVQARKKRFRAAMKDVCRVGDVSSLATAVAAYVAVSNHYAAKSTSPRKSVCHGLTFTVQSPYAAPAVTRSNQDDGICQAGVGNPKVR